MIKNAAFICLLLFCYSAPVFSQTTKDSLLTLLANTHKDTSKLKILNKLYQYYHFQGNEASRNIDSAEYYINTAYSLTQKMGLENRGVCITIMAKANFMFQEKKDPVNSIELHLKVISIAENIKDTLVIAQSCHAIGNIYTYQHLTQKALSYYLKSQNLNEKKNLARYTSISSNVLGYTYQSLSKMDSAEYYFKKAINLSIETPDKYRLQSFLYNIINFYQIQKNASQAQYYLDLAFLNKDKATDPLNYTARQLNIGKYYQSNKQYDKAVAYFVEVINPKQKDKTVSEDELVVEAYRCLSDCYKEMKDYKNAFFSIQRQKTYEDSTNKIIFSRDTAFKIVELQAGFDVEKANIGLKTQRNYTIGLLILSLLAAGIALLIYRNNRIKEETNRQLTLQGQLLETQKKELSLLNATKDKLLSLIAHDIRAPLSSLTTLLTLWDAKIISGEKFDKISSKVRSNLHYLRISLDNLLVWSTAQLKGIKPKPEKTNIHEIINNEVHLLNDTAENKGVTLVYTVPETVYCAKTDTVQLSIVVRNILANAIKFTNKDGKIQIFVQPETHFFTIHIADNGIGMSKELQEHLFDSEIDSIRRGTANEKGTG
jgi:signal transduction histidine kinase